ncbi:MAG: hypothetical protein ACXWPS_01910 [Ktedonobacteraceae bacterium]
MFGSYILDVAIGLVFVYMLLSLLCSTINEQVITRILSLRAKTLEAGIQNMLADPQGTLTKQVYDNPLIKGLSQNAFSENPRKPSYIPSNLFAQAVVALDVVQAYKSNTVSQNSAIPQALASLLQKANGNPQKELEYIENWYDDTMDRVSGWYKRNVQLIIFILGLVIVVGLNVDTIAIITNISNDSVIRAGLISAVQGSAASPPQIGELPKLQQVFEQIQPVIGWSASTLPTNWSSWFLKIVGLLATTFAISLGAPFWFDLLNKFMSFRSSGPPAQASSSTAVPPSAPPALSSTVTIMTPNGSSVQTNTGTAVTHVNSQ